MARVRNFDHKERPPVNHAHNLLTLERLACARHVRITIQALTRTEEKYLTICTLRIYLDFQMKF